MMGDTVRIIMIKPLTVGNNVINYEFAPLCVYLGVHYHQSQPGP